MQDESGEAALAAPLRQRSAASDEAFGMSEDNNDLFGRKISSTGA